jgi:hypothetical protein
MTLEHYITASYYLGACLWLVLYMYITVSMKELLYDNGKKVHLVKSEMSDISNLIKLMYNGDSRKVKVSAAIHVILISLLVLIPIILLSLESIISR